MKLKMDTSRLNMIPRIMMIIIAICLIASSIIAIYDIASSSDTTDLPFKAMCVCEMLPGLLILYYIKKPVRYHIFIFASLMGLLDMISDIGDIDQISTLILLTVFIDLIYIISGIHAFLGDRHSASRLFYISLAVVFLNGAALVLNLSSDDLKTMLFIILELAFNLAAYLLFTMFLLQPGVRDETMGRKLKICMTSVEAMMSLSPEAYIYRKDVDAILGIDKTAWVKNEKGPIESQHKAELYDGNRVFSIYSKKWRGDDTINISIDQRILTNTYGKSFPVRSYVFEETDNGTYLRIYSNDGVFLRILLSDESKRPKIPFLHKTDNDEKSNLVADTEEKIIGQ